MKLCLAEAAAEADDWATEGAGIESALGMHIQKMAVCPFEPQNEQA